MNTQENPPNEPRGKRAMTVIEPLPNAYFPDLRELWGFRGLFRAFVWRNFKVRYRNTALGVIWVVLQPLTMMLVFTQVFGLWVRVPSGDIPYSLYVLSGLALLFFVNRLIGDAVNIIRENQTLTSKVYFPRIILPFALVTSGLVDLLVTILLLFGMMFFHGVQPSPQFPMALCYILLLIGWAGALGICLAALGIRYRDLTFFLPIVMLFLMYMSPIVYPISFVPEEYLFWYALNPMVGIVNGFRWALLGVEPYYPWMAKVVLTMP